MAQSGNFIFEDHLSKFFEFRLCSVLHGCTRLRILRAASNNVKLRSHIHLSIEGENLPYIGNHSRKKSFANELLWHSSRENIRDSANPRKFNCPYIDRETFTKENFHKFINNRGVPKYTGVGIYRILRKWKFLCSWLPRISRNMDSSKWRVFKL